MNVSCGTDARIGLRRIYLSSVDLKLQRLRLACGRLDWSAPAQGLLEDVKRILHDLAGSAGSYGFPEASTTARQALAACRDGVLPARRTDPAAVQGLYESIGCLESYFQKQRQVADRPGELPDGSAIPTPADRADVMLLCPKERADRLMRHLFDTYGFTAAHVASMEAGAAVLRRYRPAVALLQPPTNATHVQEWCHKVVCGPGRPAPTFVFLGDAEQRLASLSAGITVALPNDTRDSELACILYRLAHREQVAHQERYRDPITGAYTQTYLRDRLDEELQRAKRYTRSLALALLSLNVGHDAGCAAPDRVPFEFAADLATQLRKSDLVSWDGGRNVCVLLPETSIPHACGTLRRLAGAPNGSSVPAGPGGRRACRFSAGVTGFPEHAHRAEDLIHLAQQALHLAEIEGGLIVSALDNLPALSSQ